MADERKRQGNEGPTATEMGRKPEDWERQPGESEEAFSAFVVYRDQEPPRSIRRACEEDGRTETLFSRWASKHKWVPRVAAWDREKDRVKREADLKGRAEMGKRHATEAAELQDALMLPGRELAKRYREAVAKDEDIFKDIPTVDLIKEATKAARVYAQVGVFERLSRGMSTTNVGGHEGGPIEFEHRERVEKMPRSDIESYLLGFDEGRQAAEKHGLPPPLDVGADGDGDGG